MATYGDLINRVIGELARPDLTIEAGYAIQDAIKFYQGKLFWFNEGIDVGVTTSGQATYGVPGDFIEADVLEITQGSTDTALRPISYDRLMAMDSGSGNRGLPRFYTTYRGEFRLYPVPDAAYTLTLSFARRLPTLSGLTDTNAWTNEGEELIRLRAKKTMLANVVQDYDGAVAMQKLETQVLESLLAETQRRTHTGELRAWW